MVDETETESERPARSADAATPSEPRPFGGSIEDVRAFCAVARSGSISAAARELGETKGGISRRVSRLERRLDTHLLARAPRAVSLTEEGVAFHARAAEALAMLGDAAEDARGSRRAPQGHLRVTAPMDFGIDVLPALVTRFRAQYPRITIELLLTGAPLDLAAHRVDLALRAASRAGLPDMDYRAVPLVDFDMNLYAAPAYLADRDEPRQPSDLAAHELVTPDHVVAGTTLALTDARGRRHQQTVQPAIRTGDIASVSRIVAAGGGIGPMPAIVAAPALEEGTLRRILPDWTVERARLYGITVGGRDAPARVRLFRDFLRAALAERGAARLDPDA